MSTFKGDWKPGNVTKDYRDNYEDINWADNTSNNHVAHMDNITDGSSEPDIGDIGTGAGSSEVERSTDNREADGSNPSQPTTLPDTPSRTPGMLGPSSLWA